jgi:hypothetical protein
MNADFSYTFLKHSAAGNVVSQRVEDGYIDATTLCELAGLPFHRYEPLESNGRFLRALALREWISVPDLIQRLRDEHGRERIWVHPKVAIHLAQWLSGDFAVLVSDWVFEWLNSRGREDSVGKPMLPTHLARYMANDSKIPVGYFSILQEAGLGLFGPLHTEGFDIPSSWVPDISIGRTFCDWLRRERGVDTDGLYVYDHDYQDGRIVEAKLYPDHLLADFRRWFREVWLPEYGVNYFTKKDPASLGYLKRIPALAPPEEACKARPPRRPTRRPLPKPKP